MNLDELEAKARAASEARTAEQGHRPTHGADGMPEPEWVDLAVAARDALSDFWEAACDPDTVLHLIEIARAGEASDAALERWESLAHSPQEAAHVHVRSVDRGNGEGNFCAICTEAVD